MQDEHWCVKELNVSTFMKQLNDAITTGPDETPAKV